MCRRHVFRRRHDVKAGDDDVADDDIAEGIGHVACLVLTGWGRSKKFPPRHETGIALE